MLAVADRGAEDTEAILLAIRRSGFAVLHAIDDDAFVRIARTLGEIVDDTQVRVVPGRRTYLANPNAIPLHTDHPRADLVAWRCIVQDECDGASLIADGRDVLQSLEPDTLAVLGRIDLPAMERLGDPPSPTPIARPDLDRWHFFYAPWLEPVVMPAGGVPALAALRRTIDGRAAAAAAIRLHPGDVLIVDNHRMLHGRGRIMPASRRRLRRFWIATPPELWRQQDRSP